MSNQGEFSANWIIEKISLYAEAIREPFSERELRLLRSTLSDFSEENRSEFLAVNGKTVRMIRETITDEKLAGAECIEARQGLYIPASWRDNYLAVYDSQMPWMISHCAQSAMLSEPTLGEASWWQSPLVTSGFRPSVINSDETKPTASTSSDDEFNSLVSSFQSFISVGGLFKVFTSMIQRALDQPLSDSDYQGWSRVEAIVIAFTLSDLDDDVTASFAHLIFDKEILSTEVNHRESLSSKTVPGVGKVFSKEKIMNWEVAQNFSLNKPTTVLKLAFALDGMCETLGIEPVGVKLYAIKAAQLAGTVVASSIFSSKSDINMHAAFDYGSFLKACVTVAESPDLNSKSEDEILSEILNLKQSNSRIGDLIELTDWGKEFMSTLSEWQDNFTEVCLELARNRLGVENISDEEESDFENDRRPKVKTSDRSASARLKNLNELWHNGDITLDEYTAKRNQIINEI